ncbi:MAG: isochorismatase family protein [Leptospirales bacterium]|nr:isochorismatase family protein [Leptospirales bacterium]
MRVLLSESCGLLIDVQERLLPAIHNSPALLDSIGLLLRGLSLLGAPLLVSEQYRKGLGPTVTTLQDCLQQNGYGESLQAAIDKTSFSCCGHSGFVQKLEGLQRRSVILMGIESHVCVQQTAIDLLTAGYTVVVVADCVASRRPEHKDLALHRLRHEGAIVTSAESLLFELCREAGTERFKAISALVR